MTALEFALKSALSVLHRSGRSLALVGGLAVSARTQPRFTRDLDLAVVVQDDRDAESVVRMFVLAGYAVQSLVEQDATKRLATARLLCPGQAGVVVDLLFASSGIEPEVVRAAEELEVFPSLWLPVAKVSHLVAMKVLARDDRRRPQDRMDIISLLSVATDREIEEAERALALIESRGFSRERDLKAAFREALDWVSMEL